MNEHNIGKWLRGMCMALAVIGAVTAVLIPIRATHYCGSVSPLWLILFAEIAVVCCGCALERFYHVCMLIGDCRSFCAENAKLMREVSLWLAGGALAALALLTAHCIGAGLYAFFLFLLAVLFLAFASFAARVLSVLIARAAAIQDENDLTI